MDCCEDKNYTYPGEISCLNADIIDEEPNGKPFVKITDWNIVEIFDQKHLHGIPLDHPNPNGLVSNTRPVLTSQIIDMNIDEGWAETENTNYILMGPELKIGDGCPG